jgi:hypothetical protein
MLTRRRGDAEEEFFTTKNAKLTNNIARFARDSSFVIFVLFVVNSFLRASASPREPFLSHP